MTDSADVVLRSALDGDHLRVVAQLYRIIYGRPADVGGLRSYVGHLHDGLALDAMISAFFDSDEFRNRVSGVCVNEMLWLSALGETLPAAMAPLDTRALVLTLLQSGLVAARFPLLPSLFPDGAPLDPGDYRLWLAARARPTGGAPVSLSVMLVVDDVPARLLTDTLASLLVTPSPLLEVWLAGRWFGAARRAVLHQAGASDPRVHLLQAPWRLGPAGLFNAALRRSRAEFTALVAPRDRIDPALMDALAVVADRADLVLSDEDRFDAEGLRHDPRLGAGWDPDRVVAVGRPGLVLARTSVLRAVGGMRRHGGARDLLLRAAAHVTRRGGPGRIVPVPDILLSRPDDTPVASATDSLSAARSYFRGCSIVPRGETVRVIHPVPSPPPSVSIVIATRDQAELLNRCVEGLLHRTEYVGIELVIVDNGSTEPAALTLLERLSRDPRVRVLARPGPFNWAALNNAGVAASSGKVVVLLNNDIDVAEPGWLREMVSHALRPDVGAVGAKLLYPDGRIQHAGVILTDDDHALHRWRFWPGDADGYGHDLVVTREVVAVTGACLAIRRGVYDAIGGCDAEALPVTWNDVDLCLKVRARGLRVMWTPHARLLHLEQATRGSDDLPGNQARFLREQAIMVARWGPALRDDPFRIANLYPDEAGRRLAIR